MINSPFLMSELENTLKTLKIGKSRDPENLVTELFKEDALGDDLKLSILDMMNKIKDQTLVPECMRSSNITMLHKKKIKTDIKKTGEEFLCQVCSEQF